MIKNDPKTQGRTCTVPGCTNPLATGSLIACAKHWPPERREKHLFEFFAYETPVTGSTVAPLLTDTDILYE